MRLEVFTTVLLTVLSPYFLFHFDNCIRTLSVCAKITQNVYIKIVCRQSVFFKKLE